MIIPLLTNENIEIALRLYDKLPNWKSADAIIKGYIDANKANRDLHTIAIKVVLINSLYYAGVLAPLKMAIHIKELAYKKGLDDLISKGNPEAVDLISNIRVTEKKTIKCLSFATKYCHFHNPTAYPMFDIYVYNLIKKINGREEKLAVKNTNLKNYSDFYKAVVNLIEKANFEKDFNKIDKYLWLCGQKISKDWSKLSREVKECFEKNRDLVNKL